MVILPALPPTSDQSVICPENIFATCSRVSCVAVLSGCTVIASASSRMCVSNASSPPAAAWLFSSSLILRLDWAMSTCLLMNAVMPAPEPLPLGGLIFTFGYNGWKASIRSIVKGWTVLEPSILTVPDTAVLAVAAPLLPAPASLSSLLQPAVSAPMKTTVGNRKKGRRNRLSPAWRTNSVTLPPLKQPTLLYKGVY